MKYRSAYIASSIKNAEWVRRVQQMIRDSGRSITYDWTTHGDVTWDGDARCREVAERELAAIEDADLLIVLLPGGKGTHVEIGAALALGRPVIVFADTRSISRTDSAFYFALGIIWSGGKDPHLYPSAIQQILWQTLDRLEIDAEIEARA